MRVRNRVAAYSTLALTLSACFGVPSPLAPGLRGSVGLPSHGVLTNGSQLPESGIGFERYRHADSAQHLSAAVGAGLGGGSRSGTSRQGPS